MKKILTAAILLSVLAVTNSVQAQTFSRSLMSTSSSVTSPVMLLRQWRDAPIWASHFNATSSTATSTFAGDITFNNAYGIVLPLQDTAANLASVVPQSGQRVYETDTGFTKIGDGSTTVANLRPFNTQWTTNGSNIYYNTGNVGIGTTSPYAKLSVTGEIVANNISATSTTATSTFSGGISARKNLFLSAPDLTGQTESGSDLGAAPYILDVRGGRGGSDSQLGYMGSPVNIQSGPGGRLVGVSDPSVGGPSGTVRIVTNDGGSVTEFDTNYDHTGGRSSDLYFGTGLGGHVTGGVTTFGGDSGNILFMPGDPGTTTDSVDGTTGTRGKIGIGTSTPWRTLSVHGSSDLGTNALAGSFTATSSTASVFPYASTTALTVSGMASSTFFRASQITQYGTGSTNYISGNSFRSQFYQDPTGNSAYIQFPNGNGEVTVNGRGGTTGNVLRITPASGQTGRSLRVDNNAGTEVVSILAASGNVGITTSAPRAPLSFGASLGEKIVLYEQGTQANSYNINIEAGVMRFNTPSSGASVFSSNGTTYLEVNSSGTITSPSGFIWQSNSFASPMTFNNLLRVNGTGHALPNVGIGTTSPYAKLSVVGPVVAGYFHATSTTATSTFSGHLVQGTNIVSSYLYPSFSYSTSTAWTGTTTIPLGVAFNGETWRAVKCFTDTGTLNVSINDGSNRMNMFNASTTVGNISLSTNNQFTASEKRYVDIGTPASSPTKVSCTVQKTLDIE